MVIKKKKKSEKLKKIVETNNSKKKSSKKKDLKKFSKIKIKNESDIALDFSTKAYKRFDKIIKSIVLFGSAVKKSSVAGSDIDIVIIIDDVSINWNQELIVWYRSELEKLLKENPYEKALHINTIKLSTWWDDLMRGDPVIINMIRYGEAMIDFAGFFNPLKALLLSGKIKSTPEAIYTSLQRAPMHLARSRTAELGAIDGVFWCMVDSAHAALIAANVPPASPEHIAGDLKENFVNSGKLKPKYISWYRDLLFLHKKIAHGEIKDLQGVEIDTWQERAEEFLKVMAELVKKLIE